MTDKSLIMEIHQLPERLKEEVMHFIAFLKKEYATQPEAPKAGKRVFGSSKGNYQLSPARIGGLEVEARAGYFDSKEQ